MWCKQETTYEGVTGRSDTSAHKIRTPGEYPKRKNTTSRIFSHSSFFFFQLYNSLWVLTCSIISFHCFLSCVLFFQLVTLIFLKSFLRSSSHLTLGLHFSLVAYGFHLRMVLATLSLVILSTCPNRLSRLYFMYLTVVSLIIAFSSSSFVSNRDKYQ